MARAAASIIGTLILFAVLIQVLITSFVSIRVGSVSIVTAVLSGFGGHNRPPAIFCFGRWIAYNCWWIREPEPERSPVHAHKWFLRACLSGQDATAISQGGRSWIIFNGTG